MIETKEQAIEIWGQPVVYDRDSAMAKVFIDLYGQETTKREDDDKSRNGSRSPKGSGDL